MLNFDDNLIEILTVLRSSIKQKNLRLSSSSQKRVMITKACSPLIALVLVGCLNKKPLITPVENNSLEHRVQTNIQTIETRNQAERKERVPSYNTKDLNTILCLACAAGITTGSVQVTVNDGQYTFFGTPKYSNEQFFQVLREADGSQDQFVSSGEAEVYFKHVREKYAQR